MDAFVNALWTYMNTDIFISALYIDKIAKYDVLL